jgi:putative transposase
LPATLITLGWLRWEVEPICRVLSEHGCQIGHRPTALALARKPSVRQRRDEALKVKTVRVHGDNSASYGARTVWIQLNREGISAARCTVELMGELGCSEHGEAAESASRR